MAPLLITTLRRARRAVLMAAVLCWAGRVLAAEAPPDIEAQVQAAFLPKLANFVTWPAKAFTETNSPLVIGILGTDPFGKPFDEAMKDIQVHGRAVVIRRFSEIPKPGAVHLLFISTQASARIAGIRKVLGKEPVLTVGDAGGFAEVGGMINFTKVNGKLRFEINLDVAQAAGLQISSRLLQVSRIVRGKAVP